MGNTAAQIKHAHTSQALFEQCPYRYWRERIVKDIPWEQNAAAKWGDEVHKGIEKFFETGHFPDFLYPYRDMIMAAAALKGERSIEAHLAVAYDWTPCKYKAGNAYFRGKIDVMLVRDDGVAVAVDWKTGNSKYDDGSQGERYAAMIFANFPEVNEVRTRWVYFKDKNVKRGDYLRDQELDLRDRIDSVAASIDECTRIGAWPKKPSPLCKKYCGVLNCEYNGRKP